MSLSFGYITAPTKTAAKEIVLALLEEELIACANILEGAESYFYWEDELQKSSEAIIFFKTREKNEGKIIKFVCKIHPYECPAVVFLPIANGNPDFLDWVEASC
jgi:periplasmic divalent cation tolerance protein